MDGKKEWEKIERQRDVGKPLTILFYIFVSISVLLSVNYFFTLDIGGIYFSSWRYYYLLIAFLFPFVFLFFPASSKDAKKIPIYDYIFALSVFLIACYFAYNVQLIEHGIWTIKAPIQSYIFAVILILMILESGRRTGKFVYFIVCVVLTFLPFVSGYLPGVLGGPKFPIGDLVKHLAFDSEGVLGIPMQVVGGILFGFLIFAGILIKTGAGDFFLDFATAIGGSARGGIAKVAVISSAFFGSLSGSVFSNIVGTGSFTIPGMKRSGYPGYYAGAVEACASTGGVLMPPIMGAVAFVMASITQIPYATIMMAALIPSILYFSSLFFQIDFYAAKNAIMGIPKEERPKVLDVLKDGWHYLFALAFVVWGLVYMRWEAFTPFYASALLIFLSMFKKKTRFNWKKLLETIDTVGKLLVETIGIILPLGLIVGGLVITGISSAFTSAIIDLSGGIPFLALLFGALAAFVMGMAGLVTPSYIFLAMSLAPVLVSAGFNVICVHLFIIYYSMLASITPPVAVGSFLAASIAGAPPLKTAITALRLAIVIYIIPFFFVYEPALILQGGFLEVLLHFSTAIFGIILLASATENYFFNIVKMDLVTRVLTFAFGIMMAVPNLKVTLIGVALFVMLLTYNIFKARRISSRMV